MNNLHNYGLDVSKDISKILNAIILQTIMNKGRSDKIKSILKRIKSSE